MFAGKPEISRNFLYLEQGKGNFTLYLLRKS